MTDHPCQEAPARPYYGRNDVYVAQAIDESPEWLGRVLGYLSIQPDGCWLWTRSKTADGYGRVCLPAKVKRTSVPEPRECPRSHTGPNMGRLGRQPWEYWGKPRD